MHILMHGGIVLLYALVGHVVDSVSGPGLGGNQVNKVRRGLRS